MIAQTFQMGDAAFDQGSAQQAGAARDAVELVRNGTRETHRQFILPLPQDGDGKGLAFLEMATAGGRRAQAPQDQGRSEEHTSELQSLMRISYAVFCLKKKMTNNETKQTSLSTNTKITT